LKVLIKFETKLYAIILVWYPF